VAVTTPLPLHIFHVQTSKIYSAYVTPCEDCEGANCECASHFRSRLTQGTARCRYSCGMDIAAASEITTFYAKSIQADRRHLQQTLASHGSIIVNRWKKKSREKRAAALLKVFPEIYPDQFALQHILFDNGDIAKLLPKIPCNGSYGGHFGWHGSCLTLAWKRSKARRSIS
jgi:hypothetical protein